MGWNLVEDEIASMVLAKSCTRSMDELGAGRPSLSRKGHDVGADIPLQTPYCIGHRNTVNGKDAQCISWVSLTCEFPCQLHPVPPLSMFL